MGGRANAVAAIIAKDVRLFARDRFYLFISILSLVFFGGLFWLLPASVEATAPIGVHLPDLELLLEQRGAPPDALDDGLDQAGEQGLEIVDYGSSRELERAVADGEEVVAGLDFPADFLDRVAGGQPTTVTLLLAGDAPEALRPALAGAVRELAFTIAGEEPPVAVPELEEMVLGVDRSDAPLTMRDQLRPMLVFLVLLMEMFALASLVAVEIAQRTVTAVLVTPARIGDLLAAKTLFGAVLAFGQALLIALVTGALGHALGTVLLALALGAVLATGFGLLAGATGKDFIGIVFVSVVLFIPLMIPAFAVLFPGTPALWIRALPSYGLVEVLLRTSGHGDGLAEVWPHLAALAAWCVAVFGAGTAVLHARLRRM